MSVATTSSVEGFAGSQTEKGGASDGLPCDVVVRRCPYTYFRVRADEAPAVILADDTIPKKPLKDDSAFAEMLPRAVGVCSSPGENFMVASADLVFLSLPGSALVYDLKLASHVAPTPEVDEYIAPSPVPVAEYIAPIPVLAIPEAQTRSISPVRFHNKIGRKLLLDEFLPHAATRAPSDSGVNPLGDRASPWARWRPGGGPEVVGGGREGAGGEGGGEGK